MLARGDRVIKFGGQLAAQWTIQAQGQQQDWAQRVLATQTASAERHRGEAASVEMVLDQLQELDRVGKVTREVASSAHQGLVTPLGAAASVGRKVSESSEGGIA